MTRKAYIGLSSPIFYDYGNVAEAVFPNQLSSPNPILDGPFGLLLLFDEVWFLNRALCPQNMRSLPYVKFVDESQLLDGFTYDTEIRAVEFFGQERIDHHRGGFDHYERTLFGRGVAWWGKGAAIDNHSHALESPHLDPHLHLTGNSMSADRVLLDLAIVNFLGGTFEYIGNTFTDRLLGSGTGGTDIVLPDYQAAEKILLIGGIPNYQTQQGPHHPCIDELRQLGSLSHFRRWIAEKVAGRTCAEIDEASNEVEAVLRETVQKVVRKHFDQRNEVQSLGKTFLGWGMDFAVPGVGKLWKMLDAQSEHRKKEAMRWQGFVLETRNSRGGRGRPLMADNNRTGGIAHTGKSGTHDHLT